MRTARSLGYLAGNISRTSTFDVTIDATAPHITVKEGPSFTVGGDAEYERVSFKLFHVAGNAQTITFTLA